MNCTRFAAAGIAVMALGVALPSVASAEDYCVAPNYDCGANNVQKLQDALDLAAGTQEADRILLGAGTYVAPQGAPYGFTYYETGSQVEIAGAGRGQTVVTAETAAIGHALSLRGAPGSSVHDLSIALPTQAGVNFTGLDSWNAARRIAITESENQSNQVYGAVLKAGALLEDSSVTLDPAAETIGVAMDSSSGENSLVGSAVTAKQGVSAVGPATVVRARVTGGSRGIIQYRGQMAVRDSLIRLVGAAGTAIRAEESQAPTAVTADGLTIILPETPDYAGVCAYANKGWNQPVEIALTNSVIRGGANSLCAVLTDQGSAKVSVSYSDYNPSENIALGGATIDEDHVTNVGDAGFADPANGDFRLRPGSPLVDRGDPDTAQGLDLDGNALLADGNGDGFARRDLGAFELQPPPVQPAADTQAPVISGFRARLARLRYTLSENARVTVKIQRRLAGHRARYRSLGKLTASAKQGANRTPVSRRLRRRALRPGRYRAVIVAVDAAGNRSAKKAATFRVKR